MLKPLFTYAGGKTLLLKHYNPLFPTVNNYDYYVEPFFGAGAVFGNLPSEPLRGSIIGDVNKELQNLFTQVRDNPVQLYNDTLKTLETIVNHSSLSDRKKAYYEVRELYITECLAGRWEQSAFLLFALLKTCFNGIWQTTIKSEGFFATPAGLLNKGVEMLLPFDSVMAWSEKLQFTTTFAGSYEAMPLPDDGGRILFYLDPPYRIQPNIGRGIRYNSKDFTDEDHVKLVNWVNLQTDNGHTVMFANRSFDNDPFFESLLPVAEFHYFDMTYTAGRKKKVTGGHKAITAREFLAVIN